jgi:hypothetical protein
MRLEELEEMMTEEPDEAEAAIAELVSTSSVAQLAHVARSGRVHTLRLRTIDGLGEIASDEAVAVLVEMLEANSTPPEVGGTEQRLEHAAVQARLLESLARARGVPPPAGRSQEEIAEFIEASRPG